MDMLWTEERPRDVKYAGVEDMYDDALAVRQGSRTNVVTTGGLQVRVHGSELSWAFREVPAFSYDLTRWSARQLCTMMGVPFDFAAWMVQSGVAGAQLMGAAFQYTALTREDKSLLAYLSTMENKVMAFNGTGYGRIYNATVLEKIIEMRAANPQWTLPYDAASDVRAALEARKYALTMSEHDMFVFLIHGEPLRVMDRNYYRGITVWNSEVGAKSLGISQFLYCEGCANRLILPGVFGVSARIVHRLSAPERFLSEGVDILNQLAASDPGPAVAALHKARELRVAEDRKGAVDFLRANGLGMLVAEQAADIGAGENGGDYTTLLSLLDGVTRNSQRSGFTDHRMVEDTIAGKLLVKYAA